MNVKNNPARDSFKSGKLLQILKSLSKKDLKEFERFILSPYFNNRKELLALFRILKTFYPRFDSARLNKLNIYKKLYPGKIYRDNVLRRALSNLKLLAEKYLSYREYSANKIEISLNLLSAYNKLGLNVLLQKEVKWVKQLLENSGGIDSAYFLNKFNLARIEYDNNVYSGNRKNIIENVSNRGNNLVYFFLSEYFGELNDRASYGEYYNTKLENDLFSVFKDSFNPTGLFEKTKNNTDLNSKMLLAFYLSHETFTNYRSEDLQNKFRDLLVKYSGFFSKWSQSYFFHMLISSYVAARKDGSNNYNTKLFDAYNELITNDLIVDKDTGYIQEEKIINIFTNAVTLNKYDWAEDFIEKNISKLHPDLRENWYYFFKANFSFHKNDFTASMKYILKVNFDKAVYSIKVKVLMSQILYELNCFEQLYSFIDSFHHYLDNNKSVPAAAKLNAKIFLNNIHKLTNIKYNRNYDDLYSLKNSISQQNVFYKKWLLIKIEELETLKLSKKKAL